MESNSADFPADREHSTSTSPVEASNQLQREHAMRDRMQQYSSVRDYAWFRIWGGLIMSLYVGVLLFASSADLGTRSAGSSGSFSQTSLLLVPILAFSALATGARERFGIRIKPSQTFWILMTAAFAGMATLLALSVFEVPYFTWLNAVVALAILVLFTAKPLAQLIESSHPATSVPRNYAALSKPVRWNTAIVGAFAGLLVAASNSLIASSLVMILALIGISTSFVITRSNWVLSRAGFEWGWMQWAAFGVATSTLLALSLLILIAGALSPAASTGLGVGVFLIMIVASALPAPTDASL